jgi:hypothetical protein
MPGADQKVAPDRALEHLAPLDVSRVASPDVAAERGRAIQLCPHPPDRHVSKARRVGAARPANVVVAVAWVIGNRAKIIPLADASARSQERGRDSNSQVHRSNRANVAHPA